MSCFLIRIWRIYVVNVAKFWSEYAPSKGYPPEILTEKVEEVLDYALSKYANNLFLRLVDKLKKKYGEGLIDELIRLEEVIRDYGNYSSEIIPSLGFTFHVKEILGGVFSYLPEEIYNFVIKDKEFKELGKFGEFLNKPLGRISEEDNSLEIIYGFVIEKISEESICNLAIE